MSTSTEMSQPNARVLDKTCGIQIQMALACILVAVFGGALGALHYVPGLSPTLNDMGLTFAKLRPVHTAFASLWIFGGSIAIVYHYLASSHGGLTNGDRMRFRLHTVCWLVAGAGIFVTLFMGISTGREYLGFHPVFSVILLVGWLAFAWNLLRRLRHGFFGQPIYIWFWTVGSLFFIYTFCEGHAYLLDDVFSSPIKDLQVQWKSCGTLVGSFNFMMYGALTYVGERLSGDKTYGQSPVAFWLFGVGCLNSFTNYVHHTYHLPQTDVVKWVAFLVSMAEVIILLKLMLDMAKILKSRDGGAPFCGRAGWLGMAKWWTIGMLFSSIVISWPPFNTLIHGTQLVMGHAMGATVGIDTLVLLGTASWLVVELRGSSALPRINAGLTKKCIWLISGSLAVMVIWLSAAGYVHGSSRYNGESTPHWVSGSRWLLPVAGSLLGLGLVVATARLLSMVRSK